MLTLFTNIQMKLHRLVREDLPRLVSEEDGQGLTEYALILVLIALVAIAALTLLGNQVTDELSTIANSV
jgi:pilus assembly protein Flp/PilA